MKEAIKTKINRKVKHEFCFRVSSFSSIFKGFEEQIMTIIEIQMSNFMIFLVSKFLFNRETFNLEVLVVFSNVFICVLNRSAASASINTKRQD